MSQREQAIVRRGAGLFQEDCPEIKKLPIQRLTTQMGSDDGKPDMHLPGRFRSAEVAQLAVFGFAKKSRASRRVSKIG
jgi:hypothetical protein